LDVVDIPGIDNETGISRYGDDLDIYVPVLRSFVSDAESLAKEFGCVAKETLLKYATKVHGLKGASACIGAEGLREKAAALETLAKSGDLGGVLAGNEDLLRSAQELVADITEWLCAYDRKNRKPQLRKPDRGLLFRLKESCVAFDIEGIDAALEELDRSDYETGGELVVWLKKKIADSDFEEAAMRLSRMLD